MIKTFMFLATLYTTDGPVIYVLDHGVSGAECIASMERGFLPSHATAIKSGDIRAAGESHVPATPPDDLSRAILSCEFDF